MFIIDFFAHLELSWLIKIEYNAMLFFIAGALSSQRDKHLKVQAANWRTLAIVSVCFVFIYGFQNSSRVQGARGQDLYNIFSNDFIRAVIYLVLVFFLLRRLIKTCQAERIRQARYFKWLNSRNERMKKT